MSSISGGDDDRPDLQGADHRRALRERGAPRGEHIKADEAGPRSPHLDPVVALATTMADLREMQRAPRSDWWSHLPILLAIITLIFTLIGSAGAVVISNTHLGDTVETQGNRLTVVERIQNEHSKSDARQDAVNALQDAAIQSVVRTIDQEVKARQDSEAVSRQAALDQRTTITSLMTALGELSADVKVMLDRAQRRGGLDVPQHDAQVTDQAPTQSR